MCQQFNEMKIWHCVWIGHTEVVRRKHYQGELSDEAFAEAAGATEADLESQSPHAHDHAKPTDSDGLGQPRTDNSIGETF